MQLTRETGVSVVCMLKKGSKCRAMKGKVEKTTLYHAYCFSSLHLGKEDVERTDDDDDAIRIWRGHMSRNIKAYILLSS